MTVNPKVALNDNGGRTIAVRCVSSTFVSTMVITFSFDLPIFRYGSGVITDMAHNSVSALTGSDYQFSVLDITPPAIMTDAAGVPQLSPLSGAVDQAKSTNIVMTFTEQISAATGFIVLTPSGGSGANTAYHIDITDTGVGGQIAFSGTHQNILTVNPDNDLLDMGGKTYR